MVQAYKMYLEVVFGTGALMMMLYRLVRLIETHSQALASCLLDQVESSALTPCYKKNVPRGTERKGVRNLPPSGEWLIGKDEFHLEQRYMQIGARRAHQRVPLSEVIWVIVLTKENLWEFIKKESVLERPVEVFGELEMLQLLEQFFDRRFTMPRSATNWRSQTHH